MIIGIIEAIICVAKHQPNVTFDKILISHLIIFITITSVTIWLTQLCIRIFMSRLHLHTEASQRIVAIKTYLALKRKKSVNEQSIDYVLKQIFRPLKSGLIKEGKDKQGDLTENVVISLADLIKK